MREKKPRPQKWVSSAKKTRTALRRLNHQPKLPRPRLSRQPKLLGHCLNKLPGRHLNHLPGLLRAPTSHLLRAEPGHSMDDDVND